VKKKVMSGTHRGVRFRKKRRVYKKRVLLKGKGEWGKGLGEYGGLTHLYLREKKSSIEACALSGYP